MILLNAVLKSDVVKVLVVDNQKSFTEWIQEPNTIIALSAFFVSLIALIFSIYFSYLSHKHNRLSVEPMINTVLENLDSKLSVKITIDNRGLGTAILTDINLSFNNTDYKTVYELIKVNCNPIIYSYSNYRFDNECPIASNCNIVIFKTEFKTDADYKNVLDIFRNTELTVKYDTMYRDKKVQREKIYI
jgi:hypothetical protein